MPKIFDKRIVSKITIFPRLLDDGNKIGFFATYNSHQYFGIPANGDKVSPYSLKASPRLSDNYWVEYYTSKQKKNAKNNSNPGS